MNRQYITFQALAEFISGMDILWYAAAIERATIERDHQGCWYDASHPALGQYRNLAGDVIADVLKRLGVESCSGCGCDQRRQSINRIDAWLRARLQGNGSTGR